MLVILSLSRYVTRASIPPSRGAHPRAEIHPQHLDGSDDTRPAGSRWCDPRARAIPVITLPRKSTSSPPHHVLFVSDQTITTVLLAPVVMV